MSLCCFSGEVAEWALSYLEGKVYTFRIILDIILPGMDDGWIFKRLRTAKQTPILAPYLRGLWWQESEDWLVEQMIIWPVPTISDLWQGWAHIKRALSRFEIQHPSKEIMKAMDSLVKVQNWGQYVILCAFKEFQFLALAPPKLWNYTQNSS